MSGDILEIRRELPAPVEEVFKWWSEPDLLRQWMTPVGTAEAEIDLRVGGKLRLVMRDGDIAIEHLGEFVEIDPPRRLAFTWRSVYTGEEGSLVVVDLEPVGERATLLRLTHSRLRAGAVASHGQGWGSMLDRLAAALRLEVRTSHAG